MLARGVNAGGEGLGVFGRHGIGANELDLLVEAILFGNNESQIFLGLLDSLLALAQHFEPLEARAKITLLGIEGSPDSLAPSKAVGVAFGFEGVNFRVQTRCFGLSFLENRRHIFAPFRLEELLE